MKPKVFTKITVRKIDMKKNSEKIRQALNESLTIIQKNAYMRAPVKTGRLRASFSHRSFTSESPFKASDRIRRVSYIKKKEKFSGIVGTRVPYSSLIEFCQFSKKGRQPYFYPAIQASIPEINAKFKVLFSEISIKNMPKSSYTKVWK